MAEYGFMYEGLETGRFRSRLSEIDLRRMDTVLGPQIGPELDTLRAEGGYGRFLERYTTSRSPLAHEAANHLARRIQHRRRANGFPASSDAAVREFTIAYRENEIIERYFPVTLKHSTFRWSDSEKRAVAGRIDSGMPFESTVGKNLITVVDETSVFVATILLLCCWVHSVFTRDAQAHAFHSCRFISYNRRSHDQGIRTDKPLVDLVAISRWARAASDSA